VAFWEEEEAQFFWEEEYSLFAFFVQLEKFAELDLDIFKVGRRGRLGRDFFHGKILYD
jgi:hypothetical protein